MTHDLPRNDAYNGRPVVPADQCGEDYYSDETVDRALDAARSSADPAVQKKNYIDMQAALVANPASFFAYSVNYACAYRKSVGGIKTHPMKWFDLRNATLG